MVNLCDPGIAIIRDASLQIKIPVGVEPVGRALIPLGVVQIRISVSVGSVIVGGGDNSPISSRNINILILDLRLGIVEPTIESRPGLDMTVCYRGGPCVTIIIYPSLQIQITSRIEPVSDAFIPLVILQIILGSGARSVIIISCDDTVLICRGIVILLFDFPPWIIHTGIIDR